MSWLGIALPAYPQFTSGSSGADGELTFSNARPGATILFDPGAFGPRLRPLTDHVYHFTGIRIPKDITVKLTSSLLNGPVFWLAQGPVEIEGSLDLTGGDSTDEFPQRPAVAGAGGYGGGVGALAGNPAQPGYGPGGGLPDAENAGGRFTGNSFLVPLVGGSGGAADSLESGCGGGAGGGALLIASAVSITVKGRIVADGGNSSRFAANCGGGGSGGAIRLVAPVIAGSGALSARGGRPHGGDGLIRLESSDNQFTGGLNNSPVALGNRFALFLPPSPEPTVHIVSINGVPIDEGAPTEHATAISINQATPVLLAIEARFIPPGTIIELELFSEDGSRRKVRTTPLQGTLDLSKAETTVIFPTGLSHCHVKASWKQPPIR